MRIKFLTGISCSIRGSFGPGETTEWEDVEAKRLIAAGYAEPVAPAREQAVQKGYREATK